MDTLLVIFERLTSKNSARRMSYETYTDVMRAVKPGITDVIIDAYWKTLDINNKEDGLGMNMNKIIEIKI